VTFPDIYRIASANLWRTKLRTTLTTLGVVVGIGALVSMLSFGIGMQRNVADEIRENELFTTLEVTPKGLDLGRIMSGDIASVVEPTGENAPALDAGAVDSIRAIPGVAVAYPEITFPVRVRLGEREAQTTLEGVPASAGERGDLSHIAYGRFFTEDGERAAVVGPGLLSGLKLRVEGEPVSPSREDLARMESTVAVPPDSILGHEIVVESSVIDQKRLISAVLTRAMPLREVETRLRVIGIRGRPSGFGFGRFAGGLLVPIATADSIPRLGFNNVRQLMALSGRTDEYPAVHVRVGSSAELAPVREKIEEMGFNVLAIADQLAEFRKQFLIFDALLGAVGTIALFVASLGIINTMVTSILERTREIGVMKAIGASEGDIKRIFFVEAGTVGLAGGVLGLALGWAVTRVANAIANYHLRPAGASPVELFSMPPWLLLAAVGFAVAVSLLAGVYPAARAARVDPVTALRHD
jgi:putative ABC transport system permease protein